jgi:hypothetical protein
MPGILIGNCVIKHNGVFISKPAPISAEIVQLEHREVVITFDQDLDGTSVPATTAFTIAGKTISGVAILGAEVTLTVTVGFGYGDIVTVSYTTPVINKILSLAGGLAADSFVNQAVTNNLMILFDGHTPGWYDHLDTATLVKDTGVTEAVNRWNDKLSSGHDLVQAAVGKRPIWSAADGILFDGTSHNMQGAFALDQPCMVYFVFRQVTWTLNDVILYGGADVRSFLRQRDADTVFGAYQGTAYSGYVYATVNTFYLMRWVLNGAGSKIQRNNDAAVTGNFGALGLSGLTLAANFYTASNANVQFKEIICRNVVDTGADEIAVYNYLATKHGFATI